MRTYTLSRFALSTSLAAAFLAGCGGSLAPGGPSVSSQARSQERTFGYTGKEQTFKVPVGVKLITVVARGAGGGGAYNSTHQGGRGGRVAAELPVAPGESLAIFVGGSTDGPSGGYNGGGKGFGYTLSGSYLSSYGGGGATDIRENGSALKDRILVAGGGGGLGDGGDVGIGGSGGPGGGKVAGDGAKGGGSKGGHGYHCYTDGGGGGGGTQHDGGKPGRESCEGKSGTSGALGNGGPGGSGSSGAGGGGGGGYYGGGGGGGGTYQISQGWEGSGGGGGGGSSYAEPRAQKYRNWQGWKDATGNGVVVISW
jgi:hypothetical protein